MSEAHPKPTPARPPEAEASVPPAAPPPPAREAHAPLPAKSGREAGPKRGPGRGPRPRGKRRSKPTPIREALAASGGSGTALEPDIEQVTIMVAGERWTARLRGRSGRAGAAPLLLVGFWRDGPGPADGGAPELERLVVGRTLAGLGVRALEAALEQAAPPPDPDRRPPFFSEAGEGRRR